jgi:heme/copper-type cytochrome/quinol oxidase subunit 3
MTDLSVPSSNDSASRPTIDVSHLPEHGFDWNSPVWWGNLLLMVIETVTISLLLVSYFYVRRNYNVFPPPKVDVFPPIFKTEPNLFWGTLNLSLMALACIPMWITDQFARRMQRPWVIAGLLVMIVIALLTCWIRWKEFHSVYFWWNDNAYASVVWMILGTHATYLIAASLEFLVMGAWVMTHELDDAHALDVTLAGGYWYWLSGIFAIVYAVIYFGPRLMRG